jgi:hypothetical protein
MIRIILSISVFLILLTGNTRAQDNSKTFDPNRRQENGSSKGSLNINQDPRLDTLMSRYILNNSNIRTSDGSQGTFGFRIQVYYSNVRTAREESAKAEARFLSKFPNIPTHSVYKSPGYFIIRVGDYRTKADGYKDLLSVRREFPEAYLVPDIIDFPDVKKE